MNQLTYFVPHLLALSCSSPFWEGEDMGMQSFRLMLLSSLPRTGLPERFESYGEFRRHLDALVRNGLIEDTTKIWWDIRPSSRYPDARDARVRLLHAPRRCGLPRGAQPVAGAHALPAAPREQDLAALSAHADRREPLARDALRRDASLLDLARGELVPFAELLEELLSSRGTTRSRSTAWRKPNTRACCSSAAPARTSSSTSTRRRARRARPTARRCRRWSAGWHERPARWCDAQTDLDIR